MCGMSRPDQVYSVYTVYSPMSIGTLCLTDESYEMSRLIFFEKIKQMYFRMSSAAGVTKCYGKYDISNS